MADRYSEDTFSQISLLVMEILHQVGVNEKVRSRRKNTWKQYEQLESFFFQNILYYDINVKVFGSQIEGSTTPGLQSDRDVVCFLTRFLAIRNIQDAVPGMNNYCMIRDEHTFPAYFKLQKLIPTQNGFIPLYGGYAYLNEVHKVDQKGRVVLKDPRYNEYQLDFHGPALHWISGPFEHDITFGIRVNSWVQEAIPWLMQHIHCSWISPNDLDNLLKKEAFLVPVGHSLGDEKDLEWRISFTEVERKLMWRLNNTQMACYILIKIIIKSFIKPIIGDCLSSYHCKTALFYLIDNTEKSIWKPNNFLSCLRLLLKTISLMVKEGYCPNYFIPEENMFLGKMTVPMRQQLYHILVSLIDMEFKYLLLIECDQFGQALSNACSRLCTLPVPSSDIEHLPDETSVFSIKFLPQKQIELVIFIIYDQFLKRYDQNVSRELMLTLIHGFLRGRKHLKDAIFVIIAFLSSHIGCQLASLCFASQNFHLQDIDKAHKFLLIGTESDVTSGKLKLAAFYLKLGFPALAEAVLSTVEKALVAHVSEISFQYSYDEFLNESAEKVLSEDLTTSQIFQTCIAASVTYLPSEIHIILPPLCYEMFRSVGSDPVLRNPDEHYWYDWAVVNARPYLYFLQYQTYLANGMNRHRIMALNNLVWSANKDETIFRDTSLNLLAYCLWKENLLIPALAFLCQSLQIKPEHNAAVWQICVMFYQLYQS